MAYRTHKGEPDERSVERILLIVITGTVALMGVAVAIRYMGQPLLEHHGFRQTQTALSALWMLREGWQLDYETPVAGYPWPIPFEFPLYQSAVALVVKLTGFPIDATGRLLSHAALLACAYPAHRMVTRLNLPKNAFWVFCALLWSSPLYLLWGRAFMIETFATFLAFAALAFALDLRERTISFRSAFVCTLLGTLACLQKITTGAPAIVVASLIWLGYWYRRGDSHLPPLPNIVAAAFCFGFPILMSILWTQHTDAVKEANALGQQLTSEALSSWNLGTLKQRLSVYLYGEVLWRRVFLQNAGGVVGVALILGASGGSADRQIRLYIAGCMALFLFPIMLFTNLHMVHDYYQASSTIFVLAALAISVSAWLPEQPRIPHSTPLVAALLVGSNLFFYSTEYYNKIAMQFDSERERALAVGSVIKNHTKSGDGIVVFGNDWNSDIAYYSERRSFTVPRFFRGYTDALENPAKYLGPVRLGAVVLCPPLKGHREDVVALEPTWQRIAAADCFVMLPADE